MIFKNNDKKIFIAFFLSMAIMVSNAVSISAKMVDIEPKFENGEIYEKSFIDPNLPKNTDIVDEVYNLPDEMVESKIKKEIEIYEGRAPDIFFTDRNITDTDDIKQKKIVLLILMELNYFLNRYNTFTTELIDFKRNMSKKEGDKPQIYGFGDRFTIKSSSNQNNANIDKVITNLSINGFDLKSKFTYSGNIYGFKTGLEFKNISSLNELEIIDSTIVGKFGKLMLVYFENYKTYVYNHARILISKALLEECGYKNNLKYLGQGRDNTVFEKIHKDGLSTDKNNAFALKVVIGPENRIKGEKMSAKKTSKLKFSGELENPNKYMNIPKFYRKIEFKEFIKILKKHNLENMCPKEYTEKNSPIAYIFTAPLVTKGDMWNNITGPAKNTLELLDGLIKIQKALKHISIALDILRQNNLVHLDVKPENMFVDEKNNVQLGDFGIMNNATIKIKSKEQNEQGEIIEQKKIVPNGWWMVRFKPFFYVAPEQNDQRFINSGYPIDIYGEGSSVFALLGVLEEAFTKEEAYEYEEFFTGKRHRIFETIPELRKKIQNRVVTTDLENDIRTAEIDLLDLIEDMTKINPEERPTAKQVLDYKFLKNKTLKTHKQENSLCLKK